MLTMLAATFAILQSVLSDLRSKLTYEPHPLRFGTSGRRGRVRDLTQLEIYINTAAELEYLLSLPRNEGGIARGEDFFIAHDLRPSSTAIAQEENGRGEICQAVVRAVSDAGLRPVNLGAIPTPALTAYALARVRGSIMVTGSHIPFELNGYKLNTSVGELLKSHEAPIQAAVEGLRTRIYAQPFETTLFNESGMFRSGHADLPQPDPGGRAEYLARYRDFFGVSSLNGRRILVYQHSAVGRDLLAGILEDLGAEVVRAGRSDQFVAIDTEAIDDAQLATIQRLVDEATASHGPFWAVVSTDGDSDRPLILGFDGNRVRFFPGDLVGMVSADYLGADAVVVPITCNDSIDRGPLAAKLEPRTRVGSPHVVAGMETARAKGRAAVCGWEANGGFLLGSDIRKNGQVLKALPTRDAFLPIFAVLFQAAERGAPLSEAFDALPRRYSRAALVRNFPRENGIRIIRYLTGSGAAAAQFFGAQNGFSGITGIDYTDGVRISFSNADVVHLRPSGNADEFRVYAVADSAERANAIVNAATAEPDGTIRSLERFVINSDACSTPAAPLSPDSPRH